MQLKQKASFTGDRNNITDYDEFIILLPPSEGKQGGGDKDPLEKLPGGVREIQRRFEEYEGSYQKLVGVKGDYLEKSIERNKNLLENPTMPAIRRYTGTLYKALEYESLKNKAYVDRHVYIMSAMFGCVSATSLIPNYKLKMGKLKAWKHWKNQTKDRFENAFVFDVLTKTHRRSVHWTDGVSIDFETERNGKRRSAGHAGKKVKGAFVRYLAENNVSSLREAQLFSDHGFAWDGESFFKPESC
jgi:hypothetical protein